MTRRYSFALIQDPTILNRAIVFTDAIRFVSKENYHQSRVKDWV